MKFEELFLAVDTDEKDTVKVDYDFKIFESSDRLKSDLKHLVKADSKVNKLKGDAIRDANHVDLYLDHLYFTYKDDIEKLANRHGVEIDDIAQAFMEI